MIDRLHRFLGQWAGEGRGCYPTVEDFAYREEMSLVQHGRPFLSYSSRTWALDDGRPLHGEHGFWRETPIGTIEVVLALTTGHTELATGFVRDGRLELTSTAYASTPTAKDVRAVRRVYEVDGDAMRYRLEMEAVGQALQLHLEAVLLRVSGSE